MDAYLSLDNKALEFQSNGAEYDVTVEEYAVLGNTEALTLLDFESGERVMLTRNIGGDAKLSLKDLANQKKKAASHDYLKELIASVGRNDWVKIEDRDLDATLIQENGAPSTSGKQDAGHSSRPPEDLKRGMIPSGRI